MDALKEKTVGCLLAAGAFLVLFGTTFTWMFGLAGGMHAVATRDPSTGAVRDVGDLNLAPLSFLVVVIGVLLVAGGVGYGLWWNANQHKGPRMLMTCVKVLGRFGFSPEGQILTSDWEIEGAENAKFYVKIQAGPGPVHEYECSREVYYQAGEGMTGDAEIQGRWLGKFTPYIGAAAPRSGPLVDR